MTIQEAIEQAAATMKLGAQAQADRGKKAYTAEMHCAIAGLAMSKVVNAEVTEDGKAFSSAQVCGALMHALYNHSAWRQKWEKAKIFPEASKRVTGLGGLLAELEEEGV